MVKSDALGPLSVMLVTVRVVLGVPVFSTVKGFAEVVVPTRTAP